MWASQISSWSRLGVWRTIAVGFWWLCLGCLCLLPGELWAQCQRLYQQAKYVDAAECMVQKAAQVARSNRFERGRWLRNAIRAWERAAATNRDSDSAALYREKAILLIQTHNRQKLYEDKEQRNGLIRERRRLRRLIGYASLIVIANHPKARICIKGFAFESCLVSNVWSRKVRPGKYEIAVLYPGEPPILQQQSATLTRRRQRAMLFRPPYVNVSIVSNDSKASMEISGKALATPLQGAGMLWTVLLPPGSYLLRLKYPHHPRKERAFVLKRDQPKVLTFPKPPALPVLRIESQPPAARVLLNGQVVGTTRLSLPLPAGRHRVELRKHCFLPIGKWINTKVNKENALTVVLKRDPIYARWKSRKDKEQMLRILGWIGFGVGVAAIGVSVVSHFEASQLQSSAIADLRENRIDNFQQFQEKGQLGNTLRTVGFVTLGAGTVLAALGLVSALTASPGPLNALRCQIPAPRRTVPRPAQSKTAQGNTTIKVTVPPQPGASAR